MALLLIVLMLVPRAGHAEAVNAADIARLFGLSASDVEVSAEGGTPSAVEVRSHGRLIGYALSTWKVSGSLGYAGKPLDILVGLQLDGRIAGASLVRHEEPILVIGVSPAALSAFITRLAGIDIRDPVLSRRDGGTDHVAGATVSSTVFKDSVIRSARTVAYARGLLGRPGGRSVERAAFEPRTWGSLVGEHAVAKLHIDRGEVAKALGLSEDAPGASFIDLYAALATPPGIGRNLLGRRPYEMLTGGIGASDHVILVAAAGSYSFLGTAWVQDGRFDRIRVVQGARAITFGREDMHNFERLAADGAPELREIAAFRIPAASGFDAAGPWRLELIVERDGKGPAVFPLDYQLPDRFLVAAAPAAAVLPAPTLAHEIWQSRKIAIAVLGLMLVTLTITLFFHDLIVRDARRHRIGRLVFLATTLVVLGGTATAQLSVINVVTFIHAVLGGFRWEQFLLDPLVFILWCFVALCLLFWGRGVFCGWLCPFGALQELLNEGARKLGVRQYEVPWPVHERLWPLKYMLFLGILGLSFQSLSDAARLAEVEPFKTVIVLHFLRGWPYVLYALALLVAGLFIERFYCRYVCPLGAALAIPARLKIFDWLKRRPQCGRECRVCATKCTVQAINPIGQIVPNECIYCLQCQANYYDAGTCVPLKQRAQRRAATPAAAKLAGGGDG